LQKQSVTIPKLNRPFSESSVAGARRDTVVSLICDPL
jgi:hypothetical protein